MRSITGSSGFISWAEISTAISCSRATRASSATTSSALPRSRLASGSSSSSSLGRAISAWAIRILCCSPPESLPDPGVREAVGVDRREHLLDQRPTSAGGQRQAEPIRIEAEPHEVACPHREVGVEQELLRDVPDLGVAARAGSPSDKNTPFA